jgi:hypothetical protein
MTAGERDRVRGGRKATHRAHRAHNQSVALDWRARLLRSYPVPRDFECCGSPSPGTSHGSASSIQT